MGKYGTSFIKRSQVCQGSARTHKRINYLAISFHGRGEESAGGEVMTGPRTDVINYHRGARRRQGLVSLLHPRSEMSFHVSKPSLGIWTENQSCLFSTLTQFQTRKEGEMPFFFPLKT